jgi:hypothetical protein
LNAAREYVARKPADRFGLYALAMELRRARAWAECFSTFEALLLHHPGYGAAYYHFGMARKESGDPAGARALWTRGLDATRGTDSKTYAELESALEGDT